jgi:hypothetical protein
VNEDIIELKDLLTMMSYYNAAESDWNSESKKRDQCRLELKALIKKLRDKGIDPKPLIESGNYLLSSVDT